jgi:hypothetical protein
MSLAEVVVFTEGNSAGRAARHDRSKPANTRVAATVPATALEAEAGEGPHTRDALAPVPRSSKLTKVNELLTAAGTKEANRGRI